MEVHFSSEPRPMLPVRRLSMSSDSQWTSQGRSVGGGSGYALSPPLSSTSSSAGPALPPSSPGLLPHLPTASSAHIRATRHLNAASIFERLGLTGLGGGGAAAAVTPSGSNNNNPAATASLNKRNDRNDGHLSPSSSSSLPTGSSSPASTSNRSPHGGEDTALPSEQFEGLEIHDDGQEETSAIALNSNSDAAAAASGPSDVTTPTGKAAEHRRTLSSGTLTTGLAPPAADSGSSARRPSTVSEEGSVPVGASPSPSSSSSPALHGSNGNSKIIAVSEDILLPFVDRPTEVRELLEETPRNRGLWDRLQEVFTPHPRPRSATTTTITASSSSSSSSTTTPATSSGDSTPDSAAPPSASSSSNLAGHAKTTWQDLETVLYTSRQNLSDQEWIDRLKQMIFPRSTPLWERLRACLGIDVDDERGGDRYEELSSDINILATGVTPPLQPIFGDASGGPSLFSSSSTAEAYSPMVQGHGASGGKSPVPSLPDDMLSPRAVLRTHLSTGGASGAGAIPIPGAVGLKPPHSPSFGASVSPIPSPNFGGNNFAGASTAARSYDRTAGGGSSSERSPESARSTSGGGTGTTARDASTRMHRRSSSGGSSFRRSFAMSSIDEDAPVNDFGSSNPQTPSEEDSPKQHMLSVAAAQQPQQQQGSDIGGQDSSGIAGLLRYKGLTQEGSSVPSQQSQSHSALFGSALSTSSVSSMSSSFPSGRFLAQGPALASPSMPLTPSSSFGSGLGLHAELPSSNLPSPSQAGLAAMARSGAPNLVSPSKRAYDEYTAVFESDDGSSVAGSVRSTGRGPGMRFSFGAAGATPGRGAVRPSSGFALAGLNTGKTSSVQSSRSNSAGNSTPRAGSMSRQ